MKKANTAGNALPLVPGIAVLLSCLTIMATSANAHEVPAKFEMNVIKDEAAGMKILEGEIDVAIDEIAKTPTGPAERFFVDNNLCVAYTLTREFALAEQACDDALDAMALRGTHRTYWEGPKVRYRAIALSNRGVLRAMTGKTELARADFADARRLSAGIRAPKVNLEYLEIRSSQARAR